MADLRENLVELLTEATRKWGCQIGLYGCMADHLIANGVTIQRWIPVAERLPDLELVDAKTDDEDLFPCLVTRKHRRAKKGKYVAKAWYDGYGFINADSVDVTEEVTHWMLLPEPPGDCHGLRPRNDGEVAGDG